METLSQREIIEAIKVLTETIRAQEGIWFKDEDLIEAASDKIKELIVLINPVPGGGISHRGIKKGHAKPLK